MIRARDVLHEFAFSASGQSAPDAGIATGILAGVLAGAAAVLGVAAQTHAETCYGVTYGTCAYVCVNSCYTGEECEVPEYEQQLVCYKDYGFGPECVAQESTQCADACC